MMKRILNAIFPMVTNYKVNKKTRSKITSTKGILYDLENLGNINLDELRERYADTLRVKDKLEDKAKTNVMGVTISITLIMGASNLLSVINGKFCQASFVVWFTFVLFIVSVTYMLFAGIFTIRMLISENIKYVISLENVAKGGDELRNDYSIRIAQNQFANTIRNNYVYTSYECIRNAFICLFIVFVFAAIPI